MSETQPTVPMTIALREDEYFFVGVASSASRKTKSRIVGIAIELLRHIVKTGIPADLERALEMRDPELLEDLKLLVESLRGREL